MEHIILSTHPLSDIINFISQPWHWSVSGAMIALVMFALIYFGREFGVSSTLRTMCAIGGAGEQYQFFKFKWKDQVWNLVFVGGAILGGFIASSLLASPEPVQVAAETQAHLANLGIHAPTTLSQGTGFVPNEIFSLDGLFSAKGFILLVLGGFLVGFGTRYAGGCTSGHAISGLSNLQLPSLIAVIGFFIGGLLMTYFILPLILTLNF